MTLPATSGNALTSSSSPSSFSSSSFSSFIFFFFGFSQQLKAREASHQPWPDSHLEDLPLLFFFFLFFSSYLHAFPCFVPLLLSGSRGFNQPVPYPPSLTFLTLCASLPDSLYGSLSLSISTLFVSTRSATLYLCLSLLCHSLSDSLSSPLPLSLSKFLSLPFWPSTTLPLSACSLPPSSLYLSNSLSNSIFLYSFSLCLLSPPSFLSPPSLSSFLFYFLFLPYSCPLSFLSLSPILIFIF